ncbi:MAG: hypothetical protein O2871_02195, partial [bacterium]|nr:hypothetical protein [bacterium]
RQADHYFVPLYIFIIIFCLDLFEKIFKNKKATLIFIGLIMVQVIYFKILIINTDSRTLASNWIMQQVDKKEVKVLRYGEYFPILDGDNITIGNVDEFFYNDLAGKDYPQYIIWSNYNLWPDDLGTEDWEKIKTRSNEDGQIMYFTGFLNLGPNVVVFHPNW